MGDDAHQIRHRGRLQGHELHTEGQQMCQQLRQTQHSFTLRHSLWPSTACCTASQTDHGDDGRTNLEPPSRMMPAYVRIRPACGFNGQLWGGCDWRFLCAGVPAHEAPDSRPDLEPSIKI
eukprot:518902-Rhodomonas_salina.1